MATADYVLITPARNEDAYIEKTFKAVIAQTVLPVKWVIVSDGSTDRTDEIVEHYASEHPFIELLRRKGDPSRNFGSQVHAINAGYDRLRGLKYDYIGNLDADVSFHADYFANLLDRFYADPELGIGGGSIFEEKNGTFQARGTNSTSSVAHAVQLFRRRCFEEIGGYVPLKYGGPDWCAEVMARMKNWRVQSFTDLPVYHHKPTLTAEGMIKGGFRQGRMDYSLGSSQVFELFKCLSRIGVKPYVIYSVIRLAGFYRGYLLREERQVDGDFMRSLRKEQYTKICKHLVP